MEFKKLNGEYIINWCTENNQIEWLKEEAAKQVTYEVIDEATGAVEVKTRPITFIELKTEFANKFMPDILPKKKEAKPKFFEVVKSL